MDVLKLSMNLWKSEDDSGAGCFSSSDMVEPLDKNNREQLGWALSSRTGGKGEGPWIMQCYCNGLSLLGTQSTEQYERWTGGPVSSRTGRRSGDRGWPKPGLSLLGTQGTEQYGYWTGGPVSSRTGGRIV